MRSKQFAKGGSGPANHMVGKQAAGKVTPGRTGKIQTTAPGAKSAAGGSKTRGVSAVTPAAPGRTSQITKGR